MRTQGSVKGKSRRYWIASLAALAVVLALAWRRPARPFSAQPEKAAPPSADLPQTTLDVHRELPEIRFALPAPPGAVESLRASYESTERSDADLLRLRLALRRHPQEAVKVAAWFRQTDDPRELMALALALNPPEGEARRLILESASTGTPNQREHAWLAFIGDPSVTDEALRAYEQGSRIAAHVLIAAAESVTDAEPLRAAARARLERPESIHLLAALGPTPQDRDALALLKSHPDPSISYAVQFALEEK